MIMKIEVTSGQALTTKHYETTNSCLSHYKMLNRDYKTNRKHFEAFQSVVAEGTSQILRKWQHCQNLKL